MTDSAGETLDILQVLRAPVGGLFRHVADLTRGLAARGHRIGVVADASTGDAIAEDVFAELETLCAHGVTRVPMSRQIGLSDISATTHVRDRIGATGARIVHGHGAKGGAYARLGARLVGAGARPAVVYTTHGGSLHYKRSTPAGFVFLTLEQLLAPLTDAVIFESAYGEGVFGEKVGAPPGIARVIHNGLQPAEFEPVAGDRRFDFLYVGELRTLKGVDVLISALARVAGPDGRPATLNIVGGGPDEAAFRAQVAAAGLADRVVFSGVQRARLAFGTAGAIIVPSRAESLPYIVLEASAAGLPTIATRVGGIGEIYGPTADRLIAADDVAALAAAMNAVLADPAAAAAEAAERRAFVERTFGLDLMVDTIVSLYRETLARRP
ncbi:MAG TPA: glycosyltransferase family 4 protein [Hyphomicrobiales bacterium]|nr:glycosyltransferase family 4 protein [Hyphomicrobiales bacterium]